MNSKKETSLADVGITSKPTDFAKIPQPPKPDLYEQIENFIMNNEKTNVQVIIGDTIFHCHMIVLQCYSKYFAEKTLEQTITLPEEKVTKNAFLMVYDWMLTTDPKVQREGLIEVISAAEYLQIESLIEQCWDCLEDDTVFVEEHAFILYMEARKFGHELIQNLMLSRICKLFLTLVASKEFVDFSTDEVCMLLNSNTIGVNSEIEVFMSAARWLNYDWNERSKYLLDLMKCVRFGLIAPIQLVALHDTNDSEEISKIVSNSEVRKMINNGLAYATIKHSYTDTNEDSLEYFMEQLKLNEPQQRQFLNDKKLFKYLEDHNCPNQMYCSYNSFLGYLDMIRNVGKDDKETK